MIGNECYKCGYVRMPMEGAGETCPRCGTVYTAEPPPRPPPPPAPVAKPKPDTIDYGWLTGDWSAVAPARVQAVAASVIVSTTESVPGRAVASIAGVVSGSYTYAFGALEEAIAGLGRNLIGSGSSPRTERQVAEGNVHVINVMRHSALDLRAQAVVGIRLQCTEISGANAKGILLIIGTGTAVRLG